MNLRTVKELSCKNKRVLLRLELNVPIEHGRVTDPTRIKQAIPTIDYLLSKKPKQLIIIAHRGRPNGKWQKKYSLRPVAKKVEQLLGRRVVFVDDDLTKDISLPQFPLLLLENLRFYPGEEANDKGFAKKLSSFADVFVNDAFGAMHRKHASTYQVATLLPSFAGLLVEKEISALSRLLTPKHPYITIIGGGKADKVSLIKKISVKSDLVLVAGASANHVLAAKEFNLAKTPLDQSLVRSAKSLLKNKKILLPLDAKVASSPKSKSVSSLALTKIPKDLQIIDLGPNSVALFKYHINRAKTIFWNGPVGFFEQPKARTGTANIAQAIAQSSAFTVLGGGDTAYALQLCKLSTSRFSHVSSGGGAAIKFIEQGTLPGIDVLKKKKNRKIM